MTILILYYFVGKLVKKENLPKEEENFQKAYVKAPSFLSIHLGIKSEILPADTDCHHFVLEVQLHYKRTEVIILLLSVIFLSRVDKTFMLEG